MRRRIWALCVVMAAVVGSACSSGGHQSDPTTTPATTASAGPNPDVIPSVITPAYVDAVFKVLNHVYGDATRTLKSADQVTPVVRVDLRSIFNDPLYSAQVAQAQQSLGGSLSNVRPDSGDAVTVVQRIIAASSTCIYVQTATSLSDVLVRPTPAPAYEYYELRKKQFGADPGNLNSTPWAISFNVDYLTPRAAPHRCVG